MLTLEIAFVNRPVILRQMLAANEEEAGGNSPITVFKPTGTETQRMRKVTSFNMSDPRIPVHVLVKLLLVHDEFNLAPIRQNPICSEGNQQHKSLLFLSLCIFRTITELKYMIKPTNIV